MRQRMMVAFSAGLLLVLLTVSYSMAAPGVPEAPGEPPVATTVSETGEPLQQDEAQTEVSPENSAAPAALSPSSYSYRHYWGFRNGQWRLTLNDARITNNSKVFVSASEVNAAGIRYIGAARYTIHNIAPRAGAVDIWVNIEWNSPIRLVVDYLVIQP